MSSTSMGILPTYQRFVSGVPAQFFSRRMLFSRRTREKYLILAVILLFAVLCFTTLFYLPDFRGGTGGTAVNSVYRVYQHMQKAGPELLIPAPPREFKGSKDPHGPPGFSNSIDHENDVHVFEDRQKLQAKIDEEYQQQKTLEKPDVDSEVQVVRTSSYSSLISIHHGDEQPLETVPPAPADKLPTVTGGEDGDPVIRMRRDKVKEPMNENSSSDSQCCSMHLVRNEETRRSEATRDKFLAVPVPRKDLNTITTPQTPPGPRDTWCHCLDDMRLMQRVAVSGLLSVMMIVLLTGAFVTRRDLNVQDNAVPVQEQVEERSNLTLSEHRGNPVPKTYVVKTPNPPLDDVTNQRREKIKEMMKHGWDNYVRYAWGKNELRPISKRGHSASIFGTTQMGATIVDGLDTLYIMGLHDEFKQGRDWIAENLDFDINSEISLFETNIRFMGSLLACYALTGDVMFRDKAAQLGERMLPAFQTETGIPHSLINLHTGASRNYLWASSGCSILSEIGTMHLEFTYLSDITGNLVFKNKVENVRKVLKSLDKPKGLYPNFIHPRTGKWGQHHISLGGLGDSFYEYLLKAWIQSGKEDVEAREMYDDAMVAIVEHMILTSPGGLLYATDLKYDHTEHKMGHLACFAGGMFAMGAKTLENEVSNHHMDIASGLTNTCHESYDRSATKLGPEVFRFIENNEAKSLKNGESYYILRPETFESYFIMWRLTKDPKYREWGWEAVQALEKHCRVPGGFTGLHNVYQLDSAKDDVQQSYFFAETLKYLYLLFSDDDLINLNEWVFNSEAHVLPIRGNPLYRQAPSL